MPPGDGLSGQGVDDALSLRATLALEEIDLGVSSRFARTQETLALALDGRRTDRLVVPELDEIRFGGFEGGPLADYRAWAWSHAPAAECPGGGESRAEVAERIAAALDVLLALPDETVLAISHALPVRYVVDAADGTFPAARITPVPHAIPFALTDEQVAAAAEALRRWAASPAFRDD